MITARKVLRAWRIRGSVGDTKAMSSQPKHDPVMLEEILEILPLHPEATVVDGTIGLGGHSLELSKRIAPGGRLIGLDWDSSMLSIARERLYAGQEVQIDLHHLDFRRMREVVAEGAADAILLDLGLNSAQVDNPERGFSFNADAQLDMRMDSSGSEPASAALNRMSMGEIEQMLWDLGDERWARAIAREIVERRKTRPLRTTQDLVACVLAAIPAGAREKRIHPSTRTFQAVRIFVNRELEGLGEALQDAAACLAPGGVLALLSYHSGEDRLVKGAFRALDGHGFAELFRKPRTPSQQEILRNPRSRSAKLRAIRRDS